MAEKRNIKRHKKRLTVRFGIDLPTRVAYTEDLSVNGLFIKTHYISPPGTRLQIELTLPNNDSVYFEGMVRWTKKAPPQLIHISIKCGMGVQITQFITGEANYQHFIAEMQKRL